MEQYDLFFSYEYHSSQLVHGLYSKLQDLYGESIKQWIDTEQPNSNDLSSRLLQEIAGTKCVLCFVTREYSYTESCQVELDIALNMSHIIIMLDHLHNLSFNIQSKLSSESRLNFYKNSEEDMWSGRVYEQFLKVIDLNIGEKIRVNCGDLESSEISTRNQIMRRFKEDIYPEYTEYRSEVSDNEFNFTLINDTDQDFQLFWVNFQGLEECNGFVMRKEVSVLDSYANHVWRLRNNQTCLVLTLGRGLFNVSNCGVMLSDLANQSKLKENRIANFFKGILPRFF